MKIFYKPWVTITFALMLLFSISVQAIPINVESGSNFFFSEFYVNEPDPGGNVTGYGAVSIIRDKNGLATYTSAPGAELTYEFGTRVNNTAILAPGATVTEYDSSYLNFFYDDSPDFNPAAGTGFNDGLLALDLFGHQYISTITGFSVDLDGIEIDGANGGIIGFFGGHFDVGNGGGFLNDILDTNTLDVIGSLAFADLDFTGSYSSLASDTFDTTFTGTGDLRGVVRSVPEPIPLAMIGFGLIGLAGTCKHKEAA